MPDPVARATLCRWERRRWWWEEGARFHLPEREREKAEDLLLDMARGRLREGP